MLIINFNESQLDKQIESFLSIASLSDTTGDGKIDMTLNPSIGEGVISISKVCENITNITFDVSLIEDIQLHLVHNQKKCIDFIYCLEGHIFQKFKDKENFEPVSFRQNSIFGRTPNSSSVLKLVSNMPTKLSIVIYDNHLKTQMVEEKYNRLLRNIACEELTNSFSVEDFNYFGRVCFKTALYAKSLFNKDYKTSSRYLYMEAAILNIIASQWDLYQEDLKSESESNPLKSSELDKVAALESFIWLNLAENLSIDRLVKVSGLNPAKLQLGFHYLFDTTISNYIKNKRLEKSVQLIRDTEFNVSELVYSVGFSSRSYFSKIFKERYGVLPSECVSNPNLIMAV